jgi:pilus assembly protein Flp/PilA
LATSRELRVNAEDYTKGGEAMLDVKPQEERERGQGLVEYALLLIFVAVVMIALLTVLGPGITNVYENLVNTL